ncbi:uncharacterized protein SPPG_08505 [Spizellomyces punctatus DAOM BR117]|uniref:Amino acid transporter transmembrane domain-containing protein n=1 Tax=Spizellomyces punctatus (strain DAOM BR117) TaxID=645134 RepID=A0A0L0H4K1_SPIPD|nr:uncharacterized protein SPPG_08505 [Spizellomyces punctatus DAOM BR117]KNC96117.1 hypothetical protein SPPG_08505 [Spizellomyces punctatus DAOM BR117]|eukprot:XP_016604157.1 hypothetical protein SPPG_08505 [Spizellomyces punctatus DAOM BR117]
MRRPQTESDVDDDNVPIIIHNVAEYECAEESSSSSDDEHSDQDEDDLNASSPRRRRFRLNPASTSYASRSTASAVIGSWMSSYARSAGFLEEAAGPVNKLRNVASFDSIGSEPPEVASVGQVEDALEREHLLTDYGTVEGVEEIDAKLQEHEHVMDVGTAPMSTFAQTVFNAVNVLMGIGILSLPFAFRITGWVVGGILLTLCCLMTHHTARLLAKCLDYSSPLPQIKVPGEQLTLFPSFRRRPTTYGDIGELAYGSRGRNFISVLFCVELMAACVALVILISDSITALFPEWHHVVVKSVAVGLIIPMTYPTSLRWASYGSLLGVVALSNLMIIILYDGLTTVETPGSLIHPAVTRIWPENWETVPLAIGLIMAGFCGHSVFPNIYRDMTEPEKYNNMLNVSYVVATIMYIFIAACGYLMFGDFTMPEITQNLPQVPSYNHILTSVTLWLTAINPLTKFPLNVNPINVQIEHSLHAVFPTYVLYPLPILHRVLLRSFTSLLILIIAILFPTFHSIMSLMGSLFAFSVCVVFPGMCYLKLFGPLLGAKEWAMEMGVVAMGVGLGTIGTIWACFVKF